MLMGFDMFNDCLETIEECEDKRESLAELGIEFTDNSIVEEMENRLIEVVLAAAPTSNEANVILWWMWENGFGKNRSPLSWNGRIQYLNNAEELWNFINKGVKGGREA